LDRLLRIRLHAVSVLQRPWESRPVPTSRSGEWYEPPASTA
jgi:hypothetical protein